MNKFNKESKILRIIFKVTKIVIIVNKKLENKFKSN